MSWRALVFAATLLPALANRATGADLIVNGGFDSGNTSFTSAYAFSSQPGTPSNCYAVGPRLLPGCYAIADSYFTYSYNVDFSPLMDHSGSTSGRMLLVNGDFTPASVWEQTVPVAASTTYLFSAWAASVISDPNPANLQIQVDTSAGCATATSFAGIGTVNATGTATWVQSLGAFTTGGSTSICLRLLNQNLVPFGSVNENDYALDDLSLDVDARVPLAAGAAVTTPPFAAGTRNVVTSDVTPGTSPVDAASVDLDPGAAGRQTSFTFNNATGSMSFWVDSAGLVTFVPSSVFSGTATCRWRVFTTDATPVPSNVATLQVTVSATAPPAITSASTTTFSVGTPGTFTVTATGTPTPSLGETGALPAGVTFVDNGNGTATLAGTPAAGTGGTWPITITAGNGVPPNATQAFTLKVTAPLSAWSLNPNAGPLAGGTPVTIYGTGFVAGAAVRFGGVAGSVTQLSDTSLTVNTPPSGSPGTVAVQLVNGDGQTISVGKGFIYNPPNCWPNTSFVTGNRFLGPCWPALAGDPRSSLASAITALVQGSNTFVLPPLWEGSTLESNTIIFFSGSPPFPLRPGPAGRRPMAAGVSGCYRYKWDGHVPVSFFDGLVPGAFRAGRRAPQAGTAVPTIVTKNYWHGVLVDETTIQFKSSTGTGVYDRLELPEIGIDLPVVAQDVDNDRMADYVSLPWGALAAAGVKDNYLGSGGTPGPTPQIWLPLADTDGDGYGDAVVFDPEGTGRPSTVIPQMPPLLPPASVRLDAGAVPLGEWALFFLGTGLAAAGWLLIRRSVG